MSFKLLSLSLSVVTAVGVAAGTARADQCEWNTEPIARKAAELVTAGSDVIELCEPCRDDKASPSRRVKTSKVVKPAKGYFALAIDGTVTDLAYLFVKTDTSVYTNVGVLAGCDPHDVSTEIRDGKPVGFRRSN